MHCLVGLKKVLLEHLDIYKQTSQKVGMEEGKEGDRENMNIYIYILKINPRCKSKAQNHTIQEFRTGYG